MADDDKKKDAKKVAEALDKLMKEAGKRLEKIGKLMQGDTLFMSMVKMLDMQMKAPNAEMKKLLKQLK